ncbi:hypothetical protein BH23ACT7_BH23ACT7_23010 [soil metagenome]
MTRLRSTIGRWAAAAATLVLATTTAVIVAAAPARAQTGTILFIKDHNVWIMAADDPSGARVAPCGYGGLEPDGPAGPGPFSRTVVTPFANRR